MEIRVPEVGESVYEATVAKWHRQDGETVSKDEILCELETDKISLELTAETAGTLSIRTPEGETVTVGAVIGAIEEAAADTPEPAVEQPERAPETPPAVVPPPPAEAAEKAETPVAPLPPAASPLHEGAGEETSRKPLTPIRKKIAERLVAARQQTAMLTTFNEADLSRIQALRSKYREHFEQKHGVALGLMPFFVKAAVEALRAFPEVNARIDGDDIVYHHYQHIGIAIGAEKGLVVPVLRDAGLLHFAEIEQAIGDFVERAKGNRLNLSDLEGGTFTISNGGVYGSLLSTPILSPPQSAVLGMHAILERPVARCGAIVIRPMMYLALSYDHRLIDGRQAVGFLKRIKELVEEPEELLLEL